MNSSIPPAWPEFERAVQLVGPDQLVLNERKPVIPPGPHQLLARVVVVGLCFSDLKLLKQFAQHVRKAPVVSGVDPEVLRNLPSYVPGNAPTVPGHEPVVEIVAVGKGVERFRPGERYFIQADWRWVRTPQSNGAFGYNFEGALQEYVLMDERLLVSPEGECMLLPAPAGERSAAAYGLVEPWACVECSYQTPERRALLKGGRLLVVADTENGHPAVTRLIRAQEPSAVDWVGVPPKDRSLSLVRTADLDGAQNAAYDDIIYLGHDADRLSALFSKAARDGRLWVATSGGRFGRPVETAIGAIHYYGLRIAGTLSTDPAEAMALVPETGEIRPKERIHIIGAGGPMGVMHVIRNLSRGMPGITVVAADLSDARLKALERLAVPLATRERLHFECYNSGAEPPSGAFDYAVIMAPVPALVSEAVRQSRAGARINIFAGIPMEKTGPVDMDLYIERGLYMFGTSGSTMRDMRIVLENVRGGRLDTNVSVAAVSGLEGAVDGIRAVERQEVAGKILVYPACRGLGLTPLEQLPPPVLAHLRDGVWTRDAEAALLARYGAAP